MHCRNVENRIQELLDDRVDPAFDADVVEHAAICADCRDLLEAQDMLLEGLSRLAVPQLPPDFSRRVVGSVTVQRRSGRRFAPAAAFIAIIATLLLVFALGPHQGRNLGPAEDAQAVASLTGKSAATADSMGLLMADFDSEEVRIAIEHFVDQLTNGERGRLQLAGTIRPLTSTLNVAFDAIRRSIPRRRHAVETDPQAGGFRDFRTLRVT